MTFYKCGHGRKKIFIRKNLVDYLLYMRWKESTGFEGDKSECFQCFYNRDKLKLSI